MVGRFGIFQGLFGLTAGIWFEAALFVGCFDSDGIKFWMGRTWELGGSATSPEILIGFELIRPASGILFIVGISWERLWSTFQYDKCIHKGILKNLQCEQKFEIRLDL